MVNIKPVLSQIYIANILLLLVKHSNPISLLDKLPRNSDIIMLSDRLQLHNSLKKCNSDDTNFDFCGEQLLV